MLHILPPVTLFIDDVAMADLNSDLIEKDVTVSSDDRNDFGEVSVGGGERGFCGEGNGRMSSSNLGRGQVVDC